MNSGKHPIHDTRNKLLHTQEVPSSKLGAPTIAIYKFVAVNSQQGGHVHTNVHVDVDSASNVALEGHRADDAPTLGCRSNSRSRLAGSKTVDFSNGRLHLKIPAVVSCRSSVRRWTTRITRPRKRTLGTRRVSRLVLTGLPLIGFRCLVRQAG